MARSEYHLDTRIRRLHVPLFSQQRRLRHLTSIAARNMTGGPLGATGTFFTLHLRREGEAFYTSEVDADCINPTWRNFNVNSFPEEMNSSSCYVIVKVWLKMAETSPADSIPILSIDWCTFFTGLLFYGDKIPKDAKRFQPNSLLFGTSEGYYGPPDSLLPSKNLEEPEYPIKESVAVDASSVRISYSLNTVNRIQTVQRAIKQTQASVRRIRTSIQERLKRSQSVREIQASREMGQLRVDMLREELDRIGRRTTSARERLTTEEQLFQDLSTEQMSRFQSLKKEKESLLEKRKEYYEMREDLMKTTALLVNRRKHLVSELSRIYPIVEFPDKKGYSICAIHLPNAEDLAGHDETMIAAALGYVTHVILMISWFLNAPLRYPLRHFGSHSTVSDLVVDKIPDKEREFPLYGRGREKAHFQYGVYLLNKNLGQLRHDLGLATNNLQATLANLYSLLQLRLSSNGDVTHPAFHASSTAPAPLQNGTVVVASSKFFVGPDPALPDPEIIMDQLRKEMAQTTTTNPEEAPDGFGGTPSVSSPHRHGSVPNLSSVARLSVQSEGDTNCHSRSNSTRSLDKELHWHHSLNS